MLREQLVAQRHVLRERCRVEKRRGSELKIEHKLKLLGPDIFRWGGGLPREGVGAKKFGTSLETRETKLL